jgi:hypothetical protein
MTLLPEATQILEIKDLQRLIKNEQNSQQLENQTINNFILSIKQECVLKSHFFSFYDIPDLIVKKKFDRPNYELVMKFLSKVKRLYLVNRITQNEDSKRPIEEEVITDEDLVPLELLDMILAKKQMKQEQRKSVLSNLLVGANKEADRKIKELKVENEKTKKIIENSMFITYLNNKLEMNHQKVFTLFYKLQLLNYHFVS